MGATDVGIAAANYVLVPADAGSRMTFQFYNSTLTPDAITIAGAVPGRT